MTTHDRDKTITSVTDAADGAVRDLADGAEARVEDIAETVEEAVEVSEEPYSYADADAEAEERQGSVAARLLSWLVLLVIGGGIALWGGPKIAPLLPEWAEPARAYLMPGETIARKEVAILRDEVNTQIEGLGGPDEDAVKALVSAELQGVEAGLGAQITALREEIAAGDDGAVTARLDSLDAEIKGLAAAMGDDISEETLAQLTGNTAALTGLRSQIAELGGLKSDVADVDALRGEVTELGGLRGELAALAARVTDVESSAAQAITDAAERMKVVQEEAAVEVEVAEVNAAEMEAQNAFNEAYAALSAAAVGGDVFEEQLEALKAVTEADIPEALAAAAPTGIASAAELRDGLGPLSHAAIRSSIKSSAGDGAASKIGAFFASQVATRSLAPSDGDSTDAILSRMSNAVSDDKLADVLTEADTLPDAAKGVLSGWLEQVTLRRDVLEAVSSLGANAS